MSAKAALKRKLYADVGNAHDFIDEIGRRVHSGATYDDVGELVAARLASASTMELQSLALAALSASAQAQMLHHKVDCVPSGSCCHAECAEE